MKRKNEEVYKDKISKKITVKEIEMFLKYKKIKFDKKLKKEEKANLIRKFIERSNIKFDSDSNLDEN